MGLHPSSPFNVGDFVDFAEIEAVYPHRIEMGGEGARSVMRGDVKRLGIDGGQLRAARAEFVALDLHGGFALLAIDDPAGNFQFHAARVV